MSYNLVIVESPAKAKTIEKFLGKNYKVAASMGHLRDLPKSQLGVDIDNDFEVKYITVRGRGKQVAELKSLAKKASKVFLATDPDREGEAIAWHLANLLNLDETKPIRVEFNEITKKRITEAMKNPTHINSNEVNAQQARRVLDRIVGYKLSPLLWRKIKKGLSAGRVQSVALKLVCEKEEQVLAFVSEEYWSIEGKFLKDKDIIEGKLLNISGKKVDIKSETEALKISSEIKKEKFIVEDIKKSEKKTQPKAPFITSTLQQEASQKINFTTKKTMMVAQQLYEGVKLKKDTIGLITYIRTDSTRISDDAALEAEEFILENFGKEYLPKKKRIYKNKSQSQDAHEAIRPGSIKITPDSVKEYLTRDQFRLYKLIWDRTIASQMASSRTESINAKIKGGKFLFTAQSSKLLFDGFTIIIDTKEKEEKTFINNLTKGESLELKALKENQHFTQPPARYTEASLVKILEELGIGRPSTYAPTIMTILSRGYVVKEEKRFFPTEMGIIVNDLLTSYFSKIIDYDFTAAFEEKLDKVEEGTLEWKEVIREFYEKFVVDLEKAENEINKIEIKPIVSEEICDKCGKNMVVKIGRYGKFLACPGFPDCRNIKPLLEDTGIKCPTCETGNVVVRRSKKGRKFFGCSNFPDCDFVSWEEPTQIACPDCGSYMTKSSVKDQIKFKCSNKKCGHEFKKDKED